MQARSIEAITDSVLAASRALVAVAARSLASVDEEVTLPQYRVLVVLCERGPLSMGQLASELRCSGSTATRLCDRLAHRGLIQRGPRAGNRREVEAGPTPAGTELVRKVTHRRRREILAIVGGLGADQQMAIADALGAFALAAGEAPLQSWSTGWDL